MFGKTYVCKQLFSSMKVTKSKLRTKLNDGHLQDVILLATSNLTPDHNKLSSKNSIKYLIRIVSIKKFVVFCFRHEDEVSKSRAKVIENV